MLLVKNIKNNNIQNVKILLDGGVDINYNDGEPIIASTAMICNNSKFDLFNVLDERSFQIFNLLLDNDVDYTIQNYKSFKTFAAFDKIDYMKILIEMSKKIPQTIIDEAVIIAATNNKIESVKYLVEKCNANISDGKALMSSLDNCCEYIPTYLISKGSIFEKNYEDFALI